MLTLAAMRVTIEQEFDFGAEENFLFCLFENWINSHFHCEISNSNLSFICFYASARFDIVYTMSILITLALTKKRKNWS